MEFYTAKLDVDAILSYPWLCENKIGVSPHKNALALDEPELTLLYGWVGDTDQAKGKEKEKEKA